MTRKETENAAWMMLEAKQVGEELMDAGYAPEQLEVFVDHSFFQLSGRSQSRSGTFCGMPICCIPLECGLDVEYYVRVPDGDRFILVNGRAETL